VPGRGAERQRPAGRRGPRAGPPGPGRLSPRHLTLEITESVLVSGVEAEQASHLATLGCQDGQGYLFARPLDAGAMTELLAKSLADGGFYLPVAQNLEAAVGT
jgi:hypothetical protein